MTVNHRPIKMTPKASLEPTSQTARRSTTTRSCASSSLTLKLNQRRAGQFFNIFVGPCLIFVFVLQYLRSAFIVDAKNYFKEFGIYTNIVTFLVLKKLFYKSRHINFILPNADLKCRILRKRAPYYNFIRIVSGQLGFNGFAGGSTLSSREMRI